MSEPRIRIQHLKVSYDGNMALKDISLTIPDRQITAIIGPSGCGKTTLLRCINRLIDSTDGVKVSGEIWVDGSNILSPEVDVISIRKKIGLLAQKPSPLPMSVYDNVAYGPRIHGTRDRKALDRTVADCLQTVSLWDEVKNRLQEPAAKLSVGQQQRLCLARSIAVKPEILLCDEPTSALDPVSSQSIERELMELKKDYTIVIVTHNIQQAMKLADYVIHLYLGELVECGTANEVFQDPKDERTRVYLNGACYSSLKTDKELNLKGTKCPQNFVYAKLALDELEKGSILRLVVDDPTAAMELPRGIEADGYELLSMKQINKTDWEIIVRR